MNTSCNTEQCKGAVLLVERMTGKQLTLPSLKGILMIVSGKSIKFRSTNLNVGIEIEIPAKITQEGTALIRGDVLGSVLSNIQEKEITFSLENENITITTTSSKQVIKSLPSDDFPTLPLVEGEKVVVDAKTFSEGIRGVFFSAAQTEIKPEIASVFVYSDNQTIVFVATDSFRLAEKKIKVKQSVDIPKLLLPYKSIPDIIKVLESCTGTVTITFNKNQASFATNGVYFTTRIIDGGFPDYRIIIPKEEKTKIVVLRQELLSLLKLSTMFVDTFSQLTITIKPGEKQVLLASTNNDVGRSQAYLDAAITGAEIEVVCNIKYLLDVFQSITEDSVTLSFTEANKAIVVRGVHDNSFLYLLMPSKR